MESEPEEVLLHFYQIFTHMYTLFDFLIINLVWFVHVSTILNETVHYLDMSTFTCCRQWGYTILQDRYRETPKLSYLQEIIMRCVLKIMLYGHVFLYYKYEKFSRLCRNGTTKNHANEIFMDGGVQTRQGIEMLCK